MQDRVEQLRKLQMNVVLMRRVAEVLMSYEPELFRAIDLDARGKTVILTGRVVGEEAYKHALELARTTAGVEEVVDRLTVVAKARTVAVVDSIAKPQPKKDTPATRALVLVSLLGVISSALFSMVKEPSHDASYTPPAAAAVATVEKAPVYPVEGTLFVEGKPAAGAQVVFHPVEGFGAPPCLATAIVGPDGRFSLRTLDNRHGSTPGKFAVTVAWYKPIPQGEEMTPEEAGSLVPASFRKRHTTPLRINIKPETSSSASVVQLPPIHLSQKSAMHRT
jgi:hypothetical protein